MKQIEALLAKMEADPNKLQELTMSQLSQLWRHCLPKQPTPAMKCLLWQGLAWYLQGGKEPLPITTQKLISAAVRASSYSSAKPDAFACVPKLKLAPLPEGTRLVRKWRGRHYEVFVSNDGADFHFNGKRYKSLTHIADEITGSHLSGPRFFGLNKKLKEAANA